MSEDDCVVADGGARLAINSSIGYVLVLDLYEHCPLLELLVTTAPALKSVDRRLLETRHPGTSPV